MLEFNDVSKSTQLSRDLHNRNTVKALMMMMIPVALRRLNQIQRVYVIVSRVEESVRGLGDRGEFGAHERVGGRGGDIERRLRFSGLHKVHDGAHEQIAERDVVRLCDVDQSGYGEAEQVTKLSRVSRLDERNVKGRLSEHTLNPIGVHNLDRVERRTGVHFLLDFVRNRKRPSEVVGQLRVLIKQALSLGKVFRRVGDVKVGQVLHNLRALVAARVRRNALLVDKVIEKLGSWVRNLVRRERVTRKAGPDLRRVRR